MEENKSTTYTVYRVARKKRDIRQKEPTISQGSVVTLLKSGKLYTTMTSSKFTAASRSRSFAKNDSIMQCVIKQ